MDLKGQHDTGSGAKWSSGVARIWLVAMVGTLRRVQQQYLRALQRKIADHSEDYKQLCECTNNNTNTAKNDNSADTKSVPPLTDDRTRTELRTATTPTKASESSSSTHTNNKTMKNG